MPFLYANCEQRLQDASECLGFTLHTYKVEPGTVYVRCEYAEAMDIAMEVVRDYVSVGTLVLPYLDMDEFYGS